MGKSRFTVIIQILYNKMLISKSTEWWNDPLLWCALTTREQTLNAGAAKQQQLCRVPSRTQGPSRNVGLLVLAQSLQARSRDPTCRMDPAHSSDALWAPALPQVRSAGERLAEVGYKVCVVHLTQSLPTSHLLLNLLSLCKNPCTRPLV